MGGGLALSRCKFKGVRPTQVIPWLRASFATPNTANPTLFNVLYNSNIDCRRSRSSCKIKTLKTLNRYITRICVFSQISEFVLKVERITGVLEYF